MLRRVFQLSVCSTVGREKGRLALRAHVVAIE